MISNRFKAEAVAPMDLNKYPYAFPHSAAPSHNLQQVDLESVSSACDFFYEFPYTCDFPVPPFPPSKVPKDVLNGMDPGVSLVFAKAEWEYTKKVILQSQKRRPRQSQVPSADSIKPGGYVCIPERLAELALHIQADPDKSFSGSYNWYYSGGILDVLNIDSSQYLVKPNGYNDNAVSITQLDVKNGSLDVPDTSFQLPLNSKQPLHQITCNNQGLLVRQYNICSFFKASGSGCDDLSVEFGSSVSSDDPFVHASLYKKSLEFCTLNTAKQLEFWEVGRKKPLCTVDFGDDNPLLDNWASAHYCDIKTVLFMDRGTIRLVDKRAPLDSCRNKWLIGNVCEDCEYIFAGSQGSHGLHYISTSHKLLGLDLRQGFCQRWTHGITHSPSLLKVFNPDGQTDSVLVGSQRGDTLVYVENTWEDDERGQSRIEPYVLPSLTEALQQARCQGHSLDPILNSRFSMSITGLCCFGEAKSFNVARCTSVGDVFVQSIKSGSKSGMADSIGEDGLMRLSHFERLCSAQYKDSINSNYMTDVKCVDHLLDAARDETYTLRETHWATEDDKKEEWRMSKRRLTSFCDYLAPKLLKSWGLDDIEEWAPASPAPTDDEEESSVTEDEKEDVTEKVFSWIVKHNPGNPFLGCDESAGSSLNESVSTSVVPGEVLMSTDDSD